VDWKSDQYCSHDHNSKTVPTNPPDTEFPYGFDFASYEDVNGDTNIVRPYIAAEIAAEDFMPLFTIGEVKTRDESGYLNGRNESSVYIHIQ